ncbi:MAG: FAD-dependent oxidoreductase [Patescibacteria group bacterium]|nr:FAD-dependent oxidoreductase [Patescibacteria group bacterium]
MKIGIIGAGFTGLSAAYDLVKNGHEVSVFEKDSKPGGLAIGYKEPGWEWTLEKHYHHWFTNDRNILNLAKEINYKVLINRPKTSVYVDGNLYQLDSPRSVILFPRLSVFDRFRMAGVIGILRYFPFWKLLEGIKTEEFLSKTMGEKAYEKIWEPQLKNKFGDFTKDIALSWFWARIKKRTPSLVYPQGGFLAFAQTLVAKIEKAGGKLYFNTEVKEIICDKEMAEIKFQESLKTKTKNEKFDKVIVTLPSFFFIKIAPSLPEDYKRELLTLKGLGAINLVLRLKEKFLKDGTYWLSVCDKKSPIMAIVEHTNFIDNKHYNNEHIVYLGNYLPSDHPYMKITADELLKIYDPYLRKINRNYKSSIINFKLFQVPFAQPIIPVNYSKIVPPFQTPLPNVYLANIQQVYPWDRGTNYAVELGQKVARLIDE